MGPHRSGKSKFPKIMPLFLHFLLTIYHCGEKSALASEGSTYSRVGEANCKNFDHCSQSKVEEANRSKNMANCSQNKVEEAYCGKRKVGETNYSKNMAHCSKNMKKDLTCSCGIKNDFTGK